MIHTTSATQYRIFLVINIVAAVSVFILFWTGRSQQHQISATAAEGRQAHDALCALNQRNIDRIETSKEFLKDHPNGIPGIPAKLIRDGIKADQSTVAILKKTIACQSRSA